MVKALLFDMDGTLVDSDPIHVEVFTDLLGEYGIASDHEFYMKHIHGGRNPEIFGRLLPNEDPHALDLRKEEMYRERLPGRLAEISGVSLFIDRMAAEGWDMAIVSNACRANVEAALDVIGQSDRFEVISLGDELARGKPDPLPYSHAMETLGIAPEHCIAFEDSPSGLHSARAAGATVVGVTSSLSAQALLAEGAHYTIQNFNDAALEDILKRTEGVAA